jgi:CheY-like chemotaxis protein
MERNCKDCPPLVLVVDDDASVRAVGADILADAGFAVLEACNADEALRILAAHPDINVVFSDVEMPGALDGLALASRVSELCPGIGIVLTSGGREIDRLSLPRDGVFVRKPYAGAVLLRRIADAMGKLDLDPGERRALSA